MIRSAGRAVLWDMDGTLIDSEGPIGLPGAIAIESITITRQRFLQESLTRRCTCLRLLVLESCPRNPLRLMNGARLPAEVAMQLLELLDPNGFETSLEGRAAVEKELEPSATLDSSFY